MIYSAITKDNVKQTMIGFAHGLTGLDISGDMNQCDPEITDVETAWDKLNADLGNHEFIAAYKDISPMMNAFAAIAIDCKGTDLEQFSADLDTVVLHLQAMSNNKMSFLENIMANKAQCALDISNMVEARSKKDFNEGGDALGDFIKVTILNWTPPAELFMTPIVEPVPNYRVKGYEWDEKIESLRPLFEPVPNYRVKGYESDEELRFMTPIVKPVPNYRVKSYEWDEELEYLRPLFEPIGEREAEKEVEFSPADYQNLMAGFVFGLEQKDMSGDIAKCTAAEQQVLPALLKVVADLKAGTIEGIEKALDDAKDVIAQYKAALPECAEYNADIAKFEADLGTVVANIGALPTHEEEFVANLMLHEKDLKADLEDIKSSYATSDYYTLGEKVGDVLRVAVLTLPSDEDIEFAAPTASGMTTVIEFYSEDIESLEEDIALGNIVVVMEDEEMEEAIQTDFEKFLNGFAYGLEQKDMSKDISQCSSAESEMMPAIVKVIADLQKGSIKGIEQAIADAQAVVEAYKNALPECANYTADVEQLESDLQSIVVGIASIPANREEFVAKIINNKDLLENDIKDLKKSYFLQDFYSAGMKIGEMSRVTVLDFPEEYEW